MERGIEHSAPIGDEVRTTTCYMCACRCGIRVHLKDGEVRYIEGNPDHPVNRGVLCAKGSAGIMQHYSPARLRRPLLRTGERGSGEFREISWEEAIGLAVEWLRPLRETDPRKLAFFTGRDQSQAPLPAGGRAASAPPTTRRTGASARSTWRRPGFTRSAPPSGSSVSRTGSMPAGS